MHYWVVMQPGGQGLSEQKQYASTEVQLLFEGQSCVRWRGRQILVEVDEYSDPEQLIILLILLCISDYRLYILRVLPYYQLIFLTTTTLPLPLTTTHYLPLPSILSYYIYFINYNYYQRRALCNVKVRSCRIFNL